MATQIIDGYGEIQLRGLNGGLFVGGFSSVAIEGETETADGYRFNNSGKRVLSDSRVTSETYTLTLESETQDLRSFELASGEQAATAASATYFQVIEATVPATSPYEITVAGLSTTNDQDVLVTMFGNGTWSLSSGNYQPLNLITVLAPSPTTGQVYADGANGKLVFNAAQAGAPVLISIPKTVTNKTTIGFTNSPTLLNQFHFSCKIVCDEFPNGLILIAPQVVKTSPFALTSDDVSVISNEFKIGTAAGERVPFKFILL